MRNKIPAENGIDRIGLEHLSSNNIFSDSDFRYLDQSYPIFSILEELHYIVSFHREWLFFWKSSVRYAGFRPSFIAWGSESGSFMAEMTDSKLKMNRMWFILYIN